MIEVAPNLWVGSQDDEAQVRGLDGWYVVSSAKEPWHRQALGYTGRAADKAHPEYLIARRPNRTILNLVDVDDPAYVRPELIEKGLNDIDDALGSDRKVLVHCNKGQSRAPTIAMLYLKRFTDKFDGLSYADAAQKFKETYPTYAPAKGMAAYAEQHWSD